jgi:hypothetical protein
LATLALVYFPFPPPSAQSDPLLGGRRPADSVTLFDSADETAKSTLSGQREAESETNSAVQELDYVAMDRGGPDFDGKETYVHNTASVVKADYPGRKIALL